MSGNLTPWLVIGALVLVSLILKGYIPIPGRAVAPTPYPHPPNTQDLGITYALAIKREAEEEFAAEISKKHSDALKAAFKAPFFEGPASGPSPSTPSA